MVFGRKLVEVLERGDPAWRFLDLVEDDARVFRRYGLPTQEFYLGDDALGVEVSIDQRSLDRMSTRLNLSHMSAYRILTTS